MAENRALTSRAIIYMILSSLFFALMGVVIKDTEGIYLFQKILFRNLIILFIIVFPMMKGRPWKQEKGWQIFTGKRENRKYLFWRAFFGQVGVFLYFYSVANMSLTDSSIVNRLSPFFVTIFAVLFLKAKLSRFQIPVLLAAFLGALIVIRPRFDMPVWPALAGIAASVTSGAAYTFLSFLGGREKPATIIFWFSVLATLTSLPFAIVWWQSPLPAQWLELLAVGIFAAGGQYFLTLSYEKAPAAEVSIYNYTHVPFSVLLGWFVFAEIPDFYSILGGSIIIAAAFFLFVMEKREARHHSPSPKR